MSIPLGKATWFCVELFVQPTSERALEENSFGMWALVSLCSKIFWEKMDRVGIVRSCCGYSIGEGNLLLHNINGGLPPVKGS